MYIGKNKIYKIEERFFNIWYLMRFGRKKDRNRVEWLVRFLSIWYTKEELQSKCTQLIKATKNNKIKEHYLYHMSEALSYTGQLDIKTEYLLKNTVKEYFEKFQSNYCKEISLTDAEVIKKALEFVKNEQSNEAIKLLIKSKKSTKEINALLGILYNEQKEYEKAEEYYLRAIESGDNKALNNLGNLYKEQKEYEKAEEYYLRAIDTGNNDALFNLGNLYSIKKDYTKAEEYYLKAIDIGNNDALFNIGNLYIIKEDYTKAEEYYLKAIESGVNDALNSLSWMYFTQGKEKNKSLELIQKSYKIKKEYANTHTYAAVLLWNEEFSKSYEKFEEWIKFEGAEESLADISEYINLLIAKGQYYKAKEYFENEKYQLKDKLKPIWYALMTLMQDEFPNEIKKMGSELQESVDDILKAIEELNQKYKF